MTNTTKTIDFWIVQDPLDDSGYYTPEFTKPEDALDEADIHHYQADVSDKYRFSTNSDGEDVISDFEHDKAFVEANFDAKTNELTLQAFYDGLGDEEAEPEETYTARLDD